jgi:hypothetical protein
MNITTIATKKRLVHRTKPMEILWGAWIKGLKQNSRELNAFDIIGIYSDIHKEGKTDFPFVVDLQVVLAYRVRDVAEFGQIYQLTFDFRDKNGVKQIFKMNDQIIAYEGDIPVELYETYCFRNVEIKDPDFYRLNIYLDRRFTFFIPLRITAPKRIIDDVDNDIITELWPEDYEEYKKKGQ